jgi:hypothetical protein
MYNMKKNTKLPNIQYLAHFTIMHECNLLTHQQICKLLLDHEITLPKWDINTLFAWLKPVQ